MYLKSIEVHGFKSFANKLVFEFHNGITGIVGPNGSGKSNVADAVRWVLGEQSAKQLRGSSMQDVIFSGTEMRKPQSYAYVALTITNEDHKLNVPYEEVQVARRVYRSGESEYLLNGTTCRLKDVQELFFDTGIGKEGYSIIGQGQIDKILSGKPEERRELFDEAAGIVKFKKRKNTAEKNLEAERQNLVRVQDILTELEKQVGPLEAQSEKAKEYLRLKEELKAYEINMFLMDYESFEEDIKETDKNLEIANKDLLVAKEERESMKTQHSEIENAVEEFNTRLEENKNKVNEGRILLGKIDNEINLTKQKIEGVIQGKEFHSERMKSIEKSLEEARKEQEEYMKTKEEATLRASEVEHEAEKLSDSLSEMADKMKEMEEELTQKNAFVYSFMDETSEITGEQQKIESMLEQNSIKKAELTGKILENKTQVAAATETMEAEAKALEEVREKLEEQFRLRNELADKIKESTDKENELNRQLQEKQHSYHVETSKLENLRNMTERYDGYGQSIRRVMEQKKSNSGIVGVVADIIKVDKKYETAVETALGGSIQNIVTEDEKTAKDLIHFLKKNRYGRATFLPLTTVSASAGRIRKEVLEEQGVIGSVASLVKKEERFTGLIEYLLGRFVLVDTIDHAIALGRKYNHSLRIVTVEGELLNPGGSMSGGAYKNSSNLLGRRREMEKLEESIAAIRKEMDRTKKKVEETKALIIKTRQKLADREEEVKKLQISENTAKIKYEQAVSVKEAKEVEYWSIANDGKELDRQKEILTETMEKITAKLSESKEKSEKNKEDIKHLNEELESIRNEEKEKQDTLAEVKLEVSSIQQKTAFVDENLKRIEGTIEELLEEEAGLKDEHSRSDTQVEDMNHMILALEEKINVTKEEIVELEASIEVDTQKKAELMLQQKDFFDKQDDLMNHIGELDKEVFRLGARKEKLDEQLSNQVNYMWTEYEVTYIGAKEFKLNEDISYTRMKSIVSETKNSIRALGDVNVNAIEDYKNVNERYELLKTQHDDLIESEAVLVKIIEDLDEEMRKQFTEKFAEIRIQFDKVFKELFGGGKGTLELVEDEDVLEAGIRIIAQPPGKKLQNMMQLSGGEKALTAISLLFAIQNLKPSPFCLLDEIEAALDDSNVKRYAKYLHKLTKNTQFIVITHRQGTMEAADALYGITMQEKGVSTLVSVKLIEEQLKKEAANK